MMRMSYRAPDIVAAIPEGRQPPSLKVRIRSRSAIGTDFRTVILLAVSFVTSPRRVELGI